MRCDKNVRTLHKGIFLVIIGHVFARGHFSYHVAVQTLFRIFQGQENLHDTSNDTSKKAWNILFRKFLTDQVS